MRIVSILILIQVLWAADDLSSLRKHNGILYPSQQLNSTVNWRTTSLCIMHEFIHVRDGSEKWRVKLQRTLSSQQLCAENESDCFVSRLYVRPTFESFQHFSMLCLPFANGNVEIAGNFQIRIIRTFLIYSNMTYQYIISRIVWIRTVCSPRAVFCRDYPWCEYITHIYL